MGSLWYPFTPLTDAQDNPPIEIVSAEGSYVTTAQGQKLLDGIASWWCCLHGHAHPHLIEAFEQQLQNFAHVSMANFTHQPALQLAQRLCDLTGLSHVFYTDNGSTSVEAAIKICWQYWQAKGQHQRQLIVGFEGGYHGDTLGCMAAGKIDEFHGAFSHAFPPSRHLPSPSQPEACLEALDRLIAEEGDTLACVIIEPLLQAAGGMLTHTPETLQQIARQCSQANIPLIADEIAVGLGRCGAMWASQRAQITPDIICTSKSLTGGMTPLSATIVSRQLIEPFEDGSNVFYHGHTYTGHALGCAVALASLALLDDDFFSHARELENLLTDELPLFEEQLPNVKTRQLGSVGIVELPLTGSRPLLPYYKAMLDQGYYLRPLGNVAYFWPPHCITPDEYRNMLESSRQTLKKLTAKEAAL